jgi:hypothetical protein
LGGLRHFRQSEGERERRGTVEELESSRKERVAELSLTNCADFMSKKIRGFLRHSCHVHSVVVECFILLLECRSVVFGRCYSGHCLTSAMIE